MSRGGAAENTIKSPSHAYMAYRFLMKLLLPQLDHAVRIRVYLAFDDDADGATSGSRDGNKQIECDIAQKSSGFLSALDQDYQGVRKPEDA